MARYQYKPLLHGEIRLALVRNIFPGPAGYKPAITISHHQLSATTQNYTALSYVWGTAQATRQLVCGDGQLLPAGENLYNALIAILKRARQKPHEPRLFWIDAICINQEDDLERNTQVSMMRDIYAGANITLGYLGKSAQDSDLAADYLAWAAGQWQYRYQRRLETVNLEEVVRKKYDSDYDMETRIDLEKSTELLNAINDMAKSPEQLFGPYVSEKTRVMKAVAALLARPFFQRTWIVQEMTVGPGVDFVCGDKFLYFRSFMLLEGFRTFDVNWAAVVDEPLKNDFYRGMSQFMATNTLRSRIADGNPNRLILLMQWFRPSRATLAADKIYSLIGVSSNSIRVDYRMAKSEVYRDFAIWCIYRGNEGDNLIYEAAISHERSTDLPSWIPDWETMPVRINLADVFTATSKWFFDAFGSKKREREADPKTSTPGYQPFRNMRLDVDGDELVTTGVVVQSILIVGAAPPSELNTKANSIHLANVINDGTAFMDRIMTYSHPWSNDIVSAMSTTLEADQSRTAMSPMRSTSSVEAFYTIDRELLYQHIHDRRYTFAQKSHLEQEKILLNMIKATAGRRLAVTSKSHPALVPASARPGDVICIIWGGRIPFVLRKQGGHFILIGDCYVHGMMHGEVFEGTDAVTELNEIRIR